MNEDLVISIMKYIDTLEHKGLILHNFKNNNWVKDTDVCYQVYYKGRKSKKEINEVFKKFEYRKAANRFIELYNTFFGEK